MVDFVTIVGCPDQRFCEHSETDLLPKPNYLKIVSEHKAKLLSYSSESMVL